MDKQFRDQLSLCEQSASQSLQMPEFERFDVPDADMLLCKDFYTPAESAFFFLRLLDEVKWQQDRMAFYGREIALPRLTAWYGDRGHTYTYSHISMQPHPWTALLLEIKRKVENSVDAHFNSVLLNLYRSGSDSVAWHQDNEPELGSHPIIASVSFGETRVFQLRHRNNRVVPRLDIPLSTGSLLIMRGETQQHWQHQIPKTKRAVERRMNLTFRFIQLRA